MPLLQDQQHRSIAFWGMAMVAAGLPLSIFLMSVGMLVLLTNWILEGNLVTKTKQFFTDPLGLSLVSLFMLYCVGMIWTEDLYQGLKEIRTKIPLLVFPLVLFTGKLPSKRRIQDVVMLFVVSCLVGVLFGIARYVDLSDSDLMNKRQLSVFISHIRFGLMLVLAFFILVYHLFSKRNLWSLTEKTLAISSALIILWFMIVLEAFTAYLTFGVVCLVTFGLTIGKRVSRRLKVYFSFGLLLLFVGTAFYVSKIYQQHRHQVPFDYRTLTTYTLNGNMYSHDTQVLYRENGHRVWSFVCWPELKKEWPKRSRFSLDGKDKKGQEIVYTAIRYMTSKGLKKDSAGVSHLSDQDIRNIEAGYTNYRHTGTWGIARRIDQILWAIEQYSWNENANSSSTMQRYVYFDVGLKIWKTDPILGVGSGDVKQSYKAAYQLDSRGLEERFQGISHNQYLTVAIGLGALGLVVFCISVCYPLYLYRKDFLFVVFTTLMLVSFMTDNTFSRQSGVILFAFFSSLLIIRKEFSEKRTS